MPVFLYQDEEKQLRQEILRLKTRLAELTAQKKQLGQTPFSQTGQASSSATAAYVQQQDFFLPRELAQQLGWDELDLLHFETDKEGHLVIQRVEMEDKQYSMIFDGDYSTVLPFDVLRMIFPNLTCIEDIAYLPACEFQTEMKDGCLLLRRR